MILSLLDIFPSAVFLQGFCFSNSPNPPPPTQKLNDLSLTVQQDFFQKVQYLKHGIYPHLQVAIFFLEGFLFECKNKYLSLPFLPVGGIASSLEEGIHVSSGVSGVRKWFFLVI